MRLILAVDVKAKPRVTCKPLPVSFSSSVFFLSFFLSLCGGSTGRVLSMFGSGTRYEERPLLFPRLVTIDLSSPLLLRMCSTLQSSFSMDYMALQPSSFNKFKNLPKK